MAPENFEYDQELRQHLRKQLASGESHVMNAEALDTFPPRLRGKKADGIEHTAWEMLEHMRIAQADILDFCINPLYQPRIWPDDYWPASSEPSNAKEWKESCRQFFADLDALQELLADAEQDLFARIPWGKGETLLREVLLVADHNSYHVGQIMLLRKALGAWP
jgi:uncharacterized damage-inducible protein DinB